jgi:lipopolysaccharide/colanic/teichoic acid biosynthesis glycosyltransferase
MMIKSISNRRLQKWLRKIGIRALDITGAALGLVLGLPLFIVVPLLIKLDSPGPVFYKQMRTGINRRRQNRHLTNIMPERNLRRQDQRREDLYGKPFYIYKFRTMAEDAERRSGAVWAMQDDPRVTTVGGWLRRLHLDELPQFWNVLRGEMSLVGPRPERPEIIRRLIVEIPDYQKRLTVKPGITGPAQICLGYDSSLDDVRRKTQLDLLYISKRSLRLQLRVLALTLFKILSSAPTIDAKLVDPYLHLERMSLQ